MKRITALISAAVVCAATGFFTVGTLAGGGLSAQPADCVPFHESFKQAQLRFSMAMGKDSIGSVYITDERMISRHSGYAADVVHENLETVKTYAASCAVPFLFAAAPTAGGIYEDTIAAGAQQASEKILLDTAASEAGSGITWIDLYNPMYAVRDSYIYYRTDRRWTSYGAFCAYKTVIRKLGFSNLGISDFVFEHFDSKFRGDLYALTKYDGVEADVVDVYTCPNGAKVQTITAPNSGNTYEALARTDTADSGYAVFVPELESVLDITTNVHNNKRILVLCDSYGSCFATFLTQHFRDITLVNLQKAQSDEAKALEPNSYDEVLLLCSADLIASKDGFKALRTE